MTVFGNDDAPHEHCSHEIYECSRSEINMILGEGRGFEIARKGSTLKNSSLYENN